MTTNIGHNKDGWEATVDAAASVSSSIDLGGYGGGLGIYIPTSKDATSVILGWLGLKDRNLDPATAANYVRIHSDTDGLVIEQPIPTEDRLYIVRPEIMVFSWIQFVLLTSASAADAQIAGSTFYLHKLG